MSQNREVSAIDRRRSLADALFPRLNCHTYLTDSRYRDDIDAVIAGGVGGFVLFDGSIDECARAIGEVRDSARHDLLLAADCEFGAAMRFDGGVAFPSMRAIGEVDDLEATEEAAFLIGNELAEIGIDWNLAPVVDVNSNPLNPIISIRSFGTEPLHVGRHGRAYIVGMQRSGILTCAKHFPGHGDTAVDSHIAMPLLDKSRVQLEDCEIIPFKAAISAGVDAVMTAHLRVPSLEPLPLPTSLSSSSIDLIRRELGFEGVIITDALDMNGLVDGYGPVDAVVSSFIAGNDVLEVPADSFDALNGLFTAYAEERISSQRIDESAQRRNALRHRRDQHRLNRIMRSDYRERADRLGESIARRSLRISDPNRAPLSIDHCIIVAGPLDDAIVDLCGSRLDESGMKLIGTVRSDAERGDVKRSIRDLIDAERLGTVAIIICATPRGGVTSTVSTQVDDLLDAIPIDQRIICTLGSPDIANDALAALRIDSYSSSSDSIVALTDVLKKMTKQGII